MEKSIQFASPDNNIFIIDIPASISEGQRTDHKLLSSEPLREPYPSLEPKSESARRRIAFRKRGHPSHDRLPGGEVGDGQGLEGEECEAEYINQIKEGLEVIRGAGLQSFCGQRCVAEASARPKKRRKVGAQEGSAGELASANVSGEVAAATVAEGSKTRVTEHDVGKLLRGLACNKGDSFLRHSGWSANGDNDDSSALPSPCGPRVVHNMTAQTRVLSIPHSGEPPQSSANFYIPPCSAALNAPIASSPSTLTALSTFLAQNNPEKPAREFELVLLDPPWPNRSARRSSAYSTFEAGTDSLGELQDLLSSLPLPDFVVEDGYVAIWITNRPKVRSVAMELFESWGVRLVEEWIWVKVTDRGQPVSELDGVWRKPWEWLLIARRESCNDHDNVTRNARRRVLFGVPDLHSRKPCLKGLFEKILFPRRAGEAENASAGSSGPALELFARYMVAGWFSWGDEALKYQWSGAWTA